MVVRIHNVSKWKKLAPGEFLELPGDHERRVRLEVNCPAPTRFDLIENGNPVFLAVVQGLEAIEFKAGAATVQVVATSEDEVWYFTSDGDQIATANVAAASFTKIATRRSRNPELERMMWKMQQNMERRFSMLEAENEALRRAGKRKQQENEADEPAAVSDATGAGGAGNAAQAAGGAAEPAPTGADGDASAAT